MHIVPLKRSKSGSHACGTSLRCAKKASTKSADSPGTKSALVPLILMNETRGDALKWTAGSRKGAISIPICWWEGADFVIPAVYGWARRAVSTRQSRIPECARPRVPQLRIPRGNPVLPRSIRMT